MITGQMIRKWLVALIGAFLLRLYYRIILHTVRYEFVGREEMEHDNLSGKGLVLGIAHCSLLVVISAWDGWPAALLASQSKDGELAANLLESRGFKVVRGSSSRGGKHALEELIESVQGGSVVGITFDGPRGPALVPKPGVAVCASHAAAGLFFAWIEPLPNALLRKPLILRLGSWDRFVLPLPFARVRVHHERIVPEGIDAHTDSQKWVEKALEMLEQRARKVYREPLRNV
jgi:lysophospholipid acyltransferase (LPLAT)-like uncharacterized protein